MATLESIPSEILSTIAFYLAVSPTYAATPASATQTRIPALASALDSSSPTTTQPIPTVFPAPLVPLLTTSKHITALLAFDANPQLYARIFAEKFDTAAIRRRTSAAARSKTYDDANDIDGGGGSGSVAEDEDVIRGSVTDSALAAELRTRCTTMKRFRAAVRSGQAVYVQPEDLFVVYLMLLENGKRKKPPIPSQPDRQCAVTCLLVPVSRPRPGRKGHKPGIAAKHTGADVGVLDYLVVDESSYVPYSALPSLSRDVWTDSIYLVVSLEGMDKEEMDDIEEFLFCLRPYVFAATQFEITYAPWTLIDLPLPRTATPYVRPPHPLNHYMTDPTPRSRLTHVPHYGTMKPLCPPILAHAAILNFFARVDKLFGAGGPAGADAGRDLTGGMDGPHAAAPEVEEGVGPASGAEAEAGEGGEGAALGEAAGHIAGFRPRPSSRYNAYTPAKRSEIFDTDYKRLERCYDPTESLGMGIEDWVGRFTGCWEGSFVSLRLLLRVSLIGGIVRADHNSATQSFFDYDAYKSMLSGESRALYEGQFGEQTQVWRLREVYVRSKHPVTRVPRSPAAPVPAPIRTEAVTGATPPWYSERVRMDFEEKSTSASPLNAGFAPNSSTFDKLVPLLAAKRTGPLSHLTPQTISASHTSGAMSTTTTTTAASTSTESITSVVVRMLESDDHATKDDYLVAMLGGLEDEELVQEAEVEEIMRRRRGEVDTDNEDEDDLHFAKMDGVSSAAKGKHRERSSAVVRPGDDLELMLVGTETTSLSDDGEIVSLRRIL
ncbi:hypothetical protein QFC22_001224 [Naganishia vaughanmartiniae]|uniref:Uncharacterized protein n=1 Tax=Naganishia vaughanmartiniae TaxID=1424756 RepID=A0ACC2XHG0_9TREE|nr:hypothetical protein QFC22_001224 [Naganishia vaughanmartiniae]